LRATDFESAASAIPPLWHKLIISTLTPFPKERALLLPNPAQILIPPLPAQVINDKFFCRRRQLAAKPFLDFKRDNKLLKNVVKHCFNMINSIG
jgi:hypothetical protein